MELSHIFTFIYKTKCAVMCQ